MINFERYILENGLRLLVHEDSSTPMVAVNLLYDVGARDESPDKTGLAHLFEHLMFSGSRHAPNFDDYIQMAGGENNAFTSNDLTNYYDILPAQNLEIALWLEADRMTNLVLDDHSVSVQRKVVVEEFKENYLNQPYGDAWHRLSDLAYSVHPYKWPTIGLAPQHVEKTTAEDLHMFYRDYYHPNNAILVVAGPVKAARVRNLVEKWFGDIPAERSQGRALPKEPQQLEVHHLEHQAGVPVDAIYMAFHAPDRLGKPYYVSDLLTDVLSAGPSARLYRRLLKEQRLFSQIESYITGNIDPGLLIIEGKLSEGVSMEAAEAGIWREIEELRTTPIHEAELEKIKNKVETNLVFSEASILNKAINLAFFELLGDADMINREVDYYAQVTQEDLQRMSKEIFTKENCSKLFYRKEND